MCIILNWVQMETSDRKYYQYLKDLKEFQNLGEEINLKEFNDWKEKVNNELSGNYKIRFSTLEFYSEYEDWLNTSSDDLPF